MIKGIVIAVISLAVVLAGYALVAYLYPVSLGNKVVTIIVEPGDSFPQVADKLLAEGVVSSRWMLRYPAQWRGIDRKLTPGMYEFKGRNSCRSVLTKLEKADFVNIRVTVPEGAPIWRVASILSERMNVDSSTVIALNTDSDFTQRLNVPCLEGYLYPDTYFFPWGTSVEKILSDMVATFYLQTDSLWQNLSPDGLSRDDIVTLASIVEAEALMEDEKPTIASVYHNRLDQRMKLDADPTVIYGLGGLDRPLWKKDLRQKTPYNTYLVKGLPPTPINSPGLEAIRAAIHPAESDYLFFVADGSGRHRFSRTNAEHNRARQEIRRNKTVNGS